MLISFNELRRIKDRLPDGSISRIASKLNISEDTVRNFFGGTHYNGGSAAGIHIEPGPDGGLVFLDDTTILELALQILKERN
jgi:hypothetical protein